MEQLNKKEIAFIDNYLRNSGVEFLDVRIEMTDHVASAIEQELKLNKEISFYDAFKSYMIKNKKNLLRNAKKHQWTADKKVLLNLKKELFKAPVLLIGFCFTAILVNVDMAQLKGQLWFQIISILILLTTYFVPVLLYSKLKISFLSRLAVYAFIINYLFYLLITFIDPLPHWLGLLDGFQVWINMGILVSAIKMSSFYKKQFSGYEKAQ